MNDNETSEDTKDSLENEGGDKLSENATENKEILNAISDDLVAEMPDASEEVIEASMAEEVAKENAERSYAHLKDNDGISFSPDLHQTNPDGTPKISDRTGKLLKKRGRKKDSTKSIVAPTNTASQSKQESDQKEAQRAGAYEAGRATANLIITLGVVIGGEEWQPIKDDAHGIDEQKQLTSAFGEYFLATGKTDIPPGWALVVSVGAYALPRFTMPKTKKRAQSLWDKFKAWRINRNADKNLKEKSE